MNKSAEKRADPKLSEAAEKTTAALQGLQSRLGQQPLGRDVALPAAADETNEELEGQLQQYFSETVAPPVRGVNEIRDRVIDGVAEKILRSWEDPRGQLSSAVKAAVIERLIERVVDRLGKGAFPDAGPAGSH